MQLTIKSIISALILSILLNTAVIAQDTIFIYFQNQHPNYAVEVAKHKDDPNERNSYPYDGGRHYHILKQNSGQIDKDISFNFWSYTPEWMDYQFEYCFVDTTILHKRDFKDQEWIEKTEFNEIIQILNDADAIYLIDENYIKKGRAYMIRVYFNYLAEE